MIPVLAIAAANVGRNLLETAAQKCKPQDPSKQADPAEFQRMLQKVASSPEFQRASFLAKEGIHDMADAQRSLSDLGSRVIHDPEVQKALAGSTGAVDLRFIKDGTVSITTSDGRQKTVQLHGDAKEAAAKAVAVLESMKSSTRPGASSPPLALSPASTPKAPGIRYKPGAGFVSALD